MDNIDQAELFDSSADHVRASIQSLRSLLVELYPPNLEQEGLESALSDLLASARARGLETSLDITRPHLVAPAAAQLLYRVAQEAVRNVVRHAGAHHLTVTTSVADGVARLAVSDDGQGMDVARASGVAEGHLGLRGLEVLVADAGGTFQVISAPGKGTTVQVGVPIL
jgi:signal transduction histidine kinase